MASLDLLITASMYKLQSVSSLIGERQDCLFLWLLREFCQSGRFSPCCTSFFYAVFAELWPCSREASGAENVELQKQLGIFFFSVYILPPLDLFHCRTNNV